MDRMRTYDATGTTTCSVNGKRAGMHVQEMDGKQGEMHGAMHDDTDGGKQA